jgi:hypothetical protein
MTAQSNLIEYNLQLTAEPITISFTSSRNHFTMLQARLAAATEILPINPNANMGGLYAAFFKNEINASTVQTASNHNSLE